MHAQVRNCLGVRNMAEYMSSGKWWLLQSRVGNPLPLVPSRRPSYGSVVLEAEYAWMVYCIPFSHILDMQFIHIRTLRQFRTCACLGAITANFYQINFIYTLLNLKTQDGQNMVLSPSKTLSRPFFSDVLKCTTRTCPPFSGIFSDKKMMTE